MKKIYFLAGAMLLNLYSSFSQTANHNHDVVSENPHTVVYSGNGNLAETLWENGEKKWKNSLMYKFGADAASFEQFIEFNQATYYKDRGSFFKKFNDGLIADDNYQMFFDNLMEKYSDLWKMEGNKNSTANRSGGTLPLTPQAVCNPSCYNINFQSGTLDGWSGYYAVAASNGCTTAINAQTGGQCGSATQSGGPDANTSNSYQVQLMTTPGSDPIAGGFIPNTPPLGGIAAMVGDGPSNGHGVGVLEQTYKVDVSNPILTVQYAVVLENPGHTCAEQPWFKIDVLDANGAAIPVAANTLCMHQEAFPASSHFTIHRAAIRFIADHGAQPLFLFTTTSASV